MASFMIQLIMFESIYYNWAIAKWIINALFMNKVLIINLGLVGGISDSTIGCQLVFGLYGIRG